MEPIPKGEASIGQWLFAKLGPADHGVRVIVGVGVSFAVLSEQFAGQEPQVVLCEPSPTRRLEFQV